MGCIGNEVLEANLSPDEQAALACAWGAGSDRTALASCAGTVLFANPGARAREVVGCALQSNGDPVNFAACTGLKLLGLDLSREQAAAVRCRSSSTSISA